jgi:cytochrome c-type biogenesis protein CcmE
MDVVSATPGGAFDGDDVASADEGGDTPVIGEAAAGAGALDLTPREPPPAAGRGATGGRRGRKWPWIVVLVGIIVGIGFVASHAINDATLFYLNADEAIARRPELGDKRFRLQGTVVPHTRVKTAGGVSFDVTFNGATVKVNHVGDPPELFQDCIPVVLEGAWSSTSADATFDSTFMIVKHTENYEAANPDRIKQAEAGGESPACAAVTPAAS